MAYSAPPPPGQPYPPGGYGSVPPAGPWPPGYPPGPPQPAPASPPGQGKGNTESLALLALLILFHVFANLYWLWADNHLIHLDEAHHMNRAVACYESVLQPGDRGLFRRLLSVLDLESPYPPLPHLAGALMIRLFGYHPDHIAASGILALTALLLGLYVLARQCLSARGAFLACMFASLSPMLLGFSRLYGPELFLTAATVWAMAALLKSDFFDKSGWAALFGFVAGMAMLVKQTAFIYLLLPAAVWIACGLARALLPRRFLGQQSRGAIARRVLFNLLVAMMITLGTCSWWYFQHLEYQHVWWSTQRNAPDGVLQAPLANMLRRALPDPSQSPERRIALDPAISFRPLSLQEAAQTDAADTPPDTENAGREAQANVSDVWDQWRHALRHAGPYYPLAAINTLAFLPLAILALLGIPALALRRNRNRVVLLLFLWVVGTGLLLTVLFVIRSPRFLLPVVPAFAIFAAMGLDAVPRPRLRSILFAVSFFLMLLQFINQTFFPLGPVRSLAIPLPIEPPVNLTIDPPEIPVFRDRIKTGHYMTHGPWRQPNTIEELFELLCAYENERPENPQAGPAAWYQVVSRLPGSLGVDFYARHYAPAPNPFRPAAVPEELLPRRPFAPVKEAVSSPEQAQPELAQAEYVWLIPGGDDDPAERLEEWLIYLHAQRFKPVIQANFPGYGPAPAVPVLVLADTRFPVFSRDLSLFELYDVLFNEGTLWTLSDADRATAMGLFEEQIRQYTQYKPLTPQVDLMGIRVEAQTTDTWIVYLVLQVREKVPGPLRVYLRGYVHEEDRTRDFESRQLLPAVQWDFDPHPPARDWRENHVVIVSRPVVAKPLRYRLAVALAHPDFPPEAHDIRETDWIQFAPDQQ